jgi:uncharacterized membrane protein
METSSEQAKDTQRLEAFSDGVFAIAITLLVLEIRVPHPEEGETLTRALLHEWPSYFGFVLSFVVIGIIWLNHHTMFKDISRSDHSLQILNLLVLLSVSFVPFPTAVLAENLKNDDGRLAATLLYGGTFTVMALIFNAIWLYASVGRRLLHEHVTQVRIQTRTRRSALGPIFYGGSLPLALISPWIAIGIYTVLALLYLIPLNE